MSIGKKEIKLLVVLGVILYGFLFYMIFVNNYIPEINDINAQLDEAKSKQRALENDLANIEQKKSELKTKTVISERIGNYVPEKSSLSDYIAYMIKLQKLMGYKLEDVKINQPVEITASFDNKDNKTNATTDSTSDTTSDTASSSLTGIDEEEAVPVQSKTGTKYYSVGVEFKADLAYNEIWNLLSYIEGGSKRIQVTKFSMTPFKNENKTQKTTLPPEVLANQQVYTTVPIGQIYTVKFTINLYTQDLEEANKLFDSSKNKYNKYEESSGLVFTVSSNTVPNNNSLNSTAVNNNSSTSSQNSTIAVPDFILEQTGYYTAGENLLIKGTDKIKDYFIYKTAGKVDVQLTINENKYTMKITYAVGKSKTINGDIPNRDLLANLKVDVANIDENKSIKINFKIINNSSHKLNINVTDTGNRIKILDRSGSEIRGNSQKEKVSIN